METDGRIRSKNIGSGEINSRTLDNIRSSNYDGSHDDPEGNPGTEGWQLLKNGFAVFNEVLVRGTIAAARITSAVIESGIVRLTAGGKIELGGDPETGTPATATLSETGIVVGPTSLTASGVQVGSDVVIDSTGLFVDDGHVQAVWGYVDTEVTENVTLGSTAITSSATNIHQIVIDPPNWVEAVYIMATGDMMVSTSTGAPHRMDTRIVTDDGGASEITQTMSQEKEATGITRSVSVSQSLLVPLSPAGRSVTVTQRGTLSGGSATTQTRFRLNVLVIGVRSAFV